MKRERERENDRSHMIDTFWFENLQLSISERCLSESKCNDISSWAKRSDRIRCKRSIPTGHWRNACRHVSFSLSGVLCSTTVHITGEVAVAIKLGRPYQSRTCHVILRRKEITTHCTTMRFATRDNELGVRVDAAMCFLVFVYQRWYGKTRLVNQVHLRLEVSFAYLHEHDDTRCFLFSPSSYASTLEKEKWYDQHLRLLSQWAANGQVVSVCWNNNEFQFRCHPRHTGICPSEEKSNIVDQIKCISGEWLVMIISRIIILFVKMSRTQTDSSWHQKAIETDRRGRRRETTKVSADQSHSHRSDCSDVIRCNVWHDRAEKHTYSFVLSGCLDHDTDRRAISQRYH